MELLIIILLYILVFLLFSFLFNFKWIIITLRSISRSQNQGGYIKLIQISIISLLIGSFILIMVHYLLNPIQIDRINIIFTVVVGWLGAVIGRDFLEKGLWKI